MPKFDTQENLKMIRFTLHSAQRFFSLLCCDILYYKTGYGNYKGKSILDTFLEYNSMTKVRKLYTVFSSHVLHNVKLFSCYCDILELPITYQGKFSSSYWRYISSIQYKDKAPKLYKVLHNFNLFSRNCDISGSKGSNLSII